MPAKKEPEETGAETPAIDPIMLLVQALERVANRPPDPVNTELQERLTQALERVSDSSLKGAELIALETRRAARPSNEVVPMRSVFNQRGEMLADYQKPLLCCKMLLPWEAEDASLTREEVELLNLVVNVPGEYKIQRQDDSTIKMTVRVEMDLDERNPTKMLINHDTGFNNEYFRLMPQMRNYLRQILAQCNNEEVRAAARRVLTSEEEAALIASGELTVSM